MIGHVWLFQLDNWKWKWCSFFISQSYFFLAHTFVFVFFSGMNLHSSRMCECTESDSAQCGESGLGSTVDLISSCSHTQCSQNHCSAHKNWLPKVQGMCVCVSSFSCTKSLTPLVVWTYFRKLYFLFGQCRERIPEKGGREWSQPSSVCWRSQSSSFSSIASFVPWIPWALLFSWLGVRIVCPSNCPLQEQVLDLNVYLTE